MQLKIAAALAWGVAVLVWSVPPAVITRDLPAAVALGLEARTSGEALGRLAGAAAVAVVPLAGCAAAGTHLRRWVIPGALALLPAASYGLALGLACAGTGVLGAGILGLLRPSALWFLLAGYAAAGLAGTWRGARRLSFRVPSRPRLTWAAAGAGALAIWYGRLTLADLAAPETFWDAMVYHLGVPARWLETGKITRVSPFFADMPLLSAMVWLPGLAWHGELPARLGGLAWGGLLAAGVWMATRAWLDRSDALLALLAGLSAPLVWIVLPHAGSDGALAACAVLSVAALARGAPSWPRGSARPPWLVLAGVIAGCATGMKWTGLAVAAAAALLALPFGPRAVALVLAPAAAVASPWMIKAWLLTGDPVFPLGSFALQTPFWSEYSRAVYGDDLLGTRDTSSLAGAVGAWWGRRYVDRYRIGLIGAAAIFPLARLLLLGPPALSARIPFLFTTLFAAVWAAAVPAHRFFLAGFALLPALALAGGTPRLWRILCWASIVVNAAWLPHAYTLTDDPWAAARGAITAREHYMKRFVHWSPDAEQYLREVARPGPGRRTLAVGEVRAWLAPPWTITNSYFEPSIFLALAAQSRDARRLFVRLRQLGVRRLLVDVPETARLAIWEGRVWRGPFPAETLQGFFRDHAEVLHARGGTWVYDVVPGARRWAVVPECFEVRADMAHRAGYTSVTLALSRLSDGDGGGALRAAYAGVAVLPRSGLAWCTLADALYVEGKFGHAVGAYGTALARGWRTSAAYRNHGVALFRLGKNAAAQQSLLYAIRLDPLSPQLRIDLQAIYLEFRKPYEKVLSP